jgi:hypothetical protein
LRLGCVCAAHAFNRLRKPRVSVDAERVDGAQAATIPNSAVEPSTLQQAMRVAVDPLPHRPQFQARPCAAAAVSQ